MLNLSVAELAEATGLAVNTIKRAEATNDEAPITAANAAMIVDALESEGVEFLLADENSGEGVRFRARRPAFRQRRRAAAD